MAEKKRLRRMEIEPADNGGHLVRHHFEANLRYRRGLAGGFEEAARAPEEHVFGRGEHKELLEHIGQHLGLKPHSPDSAAAAPEEEEEEEE